MQPQKGPAPQKVILNKRQLQRLFARTGATIEAETQLLRQQSVTDLSAANARKNRCLYELNLVSRELSRFEIDDDVRYELALLRKRIHENESALKARMQATKDVIQILGDAITHAESDGTYASGSRLPAGYE